MQAYLTKSAAYFFALWHFPPRQKKQHGPGKSHAVEKMEKKQARQAVFLV